LPHLNGVENKHSSENRKQVDLEHEESSCPPFTGPSSLWAKALDQAQRDPRDRRYESHIEQPFQVSKLIADVKTSITHCSPNISPCCRIVICKVHELVITHDITSSSNVTDVRQPKSDHIVSDDLWFCSGIEDCNADHGKQEVNIS
jgi:hypothetical protein